MNISDKQSYNLENIFYDKSEKHLGTLGVGYLQNYLVNGLASKTILLLTDKRLYQKGQAYQKNPQGQFIAVRTEKVVDIKDITGTAFINNNPLSIKVFAYISLAASIFSLFMNFNNPNDGIGYFFTISLGFCSIFCFVAHRIAIRQFFIVEYAGGYIASDSSAYNQIEISNFQKLISNIKDAHYKDKDLSPNKVNNIYNEIKIGDTTSKEQRGFTVVNVAHYGYYRCTRYQIGRVIRLIKVCFFVLWFYKLYLIAKFISNNAQRFGIEPLVDGNEHTQAHTGGNNLCYRYIHHGSQFVGRYKLGNF